MTKNHQSAQPQSQVDQLFLDLDMSILASPPERYKRYIGQVRSEYKIYADGQFIEGRTAFLKGVLSHPIFKSRQFLKLETAARDNIESELALLAEGTITTDS